MKGKKLNARERLIKMEEDKAERCKIFRELLRHVAQGYSLECFGPLSVVSIRDFMKRYPLEFVEEELEDAVRSGRGYWEGLGRQQANGTCMGNSRTWYYNMANRYGWREKLDIEAEHKGQVSVNVVSYASKKDLRDSESKIDT